jgi:lipoprotein-releasing system permease protein
MAVLMVLTASIVPARRAARLEPGDVIRGTAQ